MPENPVSNTITVDLKVVGGKALVDTLEEWFAAHFHGHPAMRDTEAYNHVRRAVDDLKSRLEAPGPAESHTPEQPEPVSGDANGAINQEPSP
jgi:hypothetical protein